MESSIPGRVVSFGAGVLVTVAVTQGVAWVSQPGSDHAVEVRPGEAHTVQGQAVGGADAAVVGIPEGRRMVVPPIGEDLPAEERIAALQQAVAELTFERDALRGQVAAAGGVPMDWPEALPEALRPEGFEATLRAALGDSGYRVGEIDCSEYPCLAVLDLGVVDDPMIAAQDVSGVLRDGTEGVLGADQDVDMGIQVEAEENGEGGAEVRVGLSMGAGGVDPRDARTGARMEALLQGG